MRLCEHTTEKYDYCPFSGIPYENLRRELFCHNYYLNNLCDEVRFPEWPIEEPFEVFRSCLQKWNEIISCRQDEILEHLPISSPEPSIEEEDVKGLSIGCHQFYSIHLLLKTQLLVCKRHPDQLEQYKYPSYGILLSCLSLPTSTEMNLDHSDILSSCLLRENRCRFVRTAVDLIFNSCLVSPLNAEELVQENGLKFLDAMLDFYIRALCLLTNAKSDEEEDGKEQRDDQSNLITEIIIHVVHTISGVVFFEKGHRDDSQIIIELSKCVPIIHDKLQNQIPRLYSIWC